MCTTNQLPALSYAAHSSHAISCAKVGEWRTALLLLAQLRAGAAEEGCERLVADTVSFNATINALGRGGQWEKALALLREMANAGGGVEVSNEEGIKI